MHLTRIYTESSLFMKSNSKLQIHISGEPQLGTDRACFPSTMATLEKCLLLSCGLLFRQYLYVIRCLMSPVSSSSTAVKLQTSICSDFKTKSKKLHH